MLSNPNSIDLTLTINALRMGFPIERLGQEAIHSGFTADILVRLHGIGCLRHDSCVC
jgi:hypothetical protein